VDRDWVAALSRLRIGYRMGYKAGVLGALVLGSVAAHAQEAGELNPGDTAWILVATALVLFMTIPGLALFYGGLVRAKNVLSVLMQCFAIAAVVSILWAVYGYAFAFDTAGMIEGTTNLHSFVGGFGGDFSKYFLRSVTRDSLAGTIPESVFAMFQLTFAIITPALIVGGFAERMKFSAVMLFTVLWATFVYFPICHMVWSGPGAFMFDHGVLDFAGGTVVHINAGVAALVAAILVGKRSGYPKTPILPHNLGLTVTGAAMLWVGWFGFNAGSALAADGAAGMAMLVTQLASAAAACTWAAIEWVKHRKPSVLGIVTGAVGGLVAITPASGFVGPMGALSIGIVAGFACFFGATTLKRAFGYDDSLDAFGVHGVGGIVGAILTGVFAAPALGGAGLVGNNTMAQQVWVQTFDAAFTVVYSGVLSFAILKLIDLTLGLRVTEQQENQGLDLTLHEESGYNF
jgi:ammonium transporter, Amt family